MLYAIGNVNIEIKKIYNIGERLIMGIAVRESNKVFINTEKDESRFKAQSGRRKSRRGRRSRYRSQQV